MGKRRRAREAAVSIISGEISNAEKARRRSDQFWEFCPRQRASVNRTAANEAWWRICRKSTSAFCRYCEKLEFRRISAVDRNVLRLAIYEMLHRDDIPPWSL